MRKTGREVTRKHLKAVPSLPGACSRGRWPRIHFDYLIQAQQP